jgi:hypothetical protein
MTAMAMCGHAVSKLKEQHVRPGMMREERHLAVVAMKTCLGLKPQKVKDAEEEKLLSLADPDHDAKPPGRKGTPFISSHSPRRNAYISSIDNLFRSKPFSVQKPKRERKKQAE